MTPTDAVGRLLFDILAMVAEFESDLIRLLTREGMKVAKAKGRLRGKKPKLNPRQEAHLVELFETGEHSTAEFGRPLRRRPIHRLPRLGAEQLRGSLNASLHPSRRPTFSAGGLPRLPRADAA